ncbi:pyrroline-5-carboxylate reductase 1, mitochondrial-like isoform X2 [Neocloeon triangulifer]|uniref:pyrroline-5-carboxylate reductase 1, mitochondrial-like isoform X2 n=1 Tax=Neocloeon triangulifer TaxID=2078957 RepID=UPI00286EFA84|nr:pyrroline-5-carboxylate reductase 1, mitochondrial-like isoform X2 [Neocloeon triangulifer]
MLKIGFLGSGKMAQALAKGFIASGLTRAENLIASSPPQDSKLLEEFQSLGGKITNDNTEVTRQADILILAVKPFAVTPVLESIKNSFSNSHLLMSIAMGIKIEALEKCLPGKPRILRAMPNTPAAFGVGASVICGGSYATPQDVDLAEKLMSAVGICRTAPETSFDAITALSGSGPAYVFTIIEALSDGGVKMGLPRDLATQLAIQTTLGAATMAKLSDDHLAVLREAVTSPGPLQQVCMCWRKGESEVGLLPL